MIGNLRDKELAVLGVDFDPEVLRVLRHRGVPVRYGDAEDMDFPENLPLAGARWMVSTLPQLESNLTLLKALPNQGYSGRIAVTSHDEAGVLKLLRAGADMFLNPYTNAADFAALQLAAELKLTVVSKVTGQ